MSVLRQIQASDFHFDVSESLYPEHRPVIISAHNSSLPKDVEADVWHSGGTIIPLTSAETLTIVSTSPNDTLFGSGARTIQLRLLDENFNEVNENLDLNGTTPIVSITPCLRLQSAILVTAGSTETNEGTITFVSTVSGTIQGTMSLEDGITQKSHFTVPAGKTAFVLGAIIYAHKVSMGQSPLVGVKAYLQGPGDAARIVVFEAFLDTSINTDLTITEFVSPPLFEKVNLKLSATSTTNNSEIHTRLYLILVNN